MRTSGPVVNSMRSLASGIVRRVPRTVILMSKSELPQDSPTPNSDDDRLDELYELREELQEIAGSDAKYAKYAENALESLREAGYDV